MAATALVESMRLYEQVNLQNSSLPELGRETTSSVIDRFRVLAEKDEALDLGERNGWQAPQ
jgi:hypothetical protein